MTTRRRLVAGAALVLLSLSSSSAFAARARPTIMVVVSEKVMGIFDTTGFEEPGHVESILAADLTDRGFAVVDLDAVQRRNSRAKARQLLEGDEISAREIALQEESEYLLIGTATSKPAGRRLFGTNMQSLQANVTVRLIRGDDGRVLGGATGQGAEAHIDEMQGGMLALTEATEKALESLQAAFADALRPDMADSELTVQVKGLVSYRHLDYLMGFFLEDLGGVEDARLRNFHGGVAEIGLATSADAETVARNAGNARFTGFRLRVTQVSRNRIEMDAVLEE